MRAMQSCGVLLLLASGLCAGPVAAQNWPAKPVRVITVESGSASDVVLRMLNPSVSAGLGQPVVVDNRASSSRPEQAILKTAPDGYNFLYWGSPLWTTPAFQQVNYDPVRDFAPVSLVAGFPSVLVINSGMPATSVNELVEMAKARPNALNVGMTGVGSTPYLAALLFSSMTGADMTSINYKSAVQGLTDLAAGRIQVFFSSVGTALPHLQSGKVRALAVTTLGRSELLPDVPPVAATYPAYEVASVQAMFAVANTPAAITSRFSQELVKAVKDPSTSKKLLSLGFEAVGSTPNQLTEKMRSEMNAIGKLVKDKGIRVE